MFVPDVIKKCVAFVGIKYANGTFKPKATGFFAHAGEDSIQRTYFVTAEHVVSNIQEEIAKDEREKDLTGRLADAPQYQRRASGGSPASGGSLVVAP
jgi:hypothetical protein